MAVKIQTAVDILDQMSESAEGEQEQALSLAISTLEDLRDRQEAEIEEAVQMVRAVLDGDESRDRAATWQFLRGKLALSRVVLDEVERRLGLAGTVAAR